MSEEQQKRKFLGVHFKCCNAYGRLYQNKQETHYVGRCPRCMQPVKAAIGKGGTNQRFFEAQ